MDCVVLTPCTDACDHGEQEDFEDHSRLVIQPDGLLEIVSPRKHKATRAVEVFAVESKPPSTDRRNYWPPSTHLCDGCSVHVFSVIHPGIATSKGYLGKYEAAYLATAAKARPDSTDRPFHKNYGGLLESAKSCGACAIFLSTIPNPNNFNSDDGRPIDFRADTKSEKPSKRPLAY